MHCLSSQNSASAPKRRRAALPISVRIPTGRRLATGRHQLDPVRRQLGSGDRGGCGAAVGPRSAGASSCRSRRSACRSACRRRQSDGLRRASAERRPNLGRSRARRRVGRQTTVEHRTDLGVVRRSRHQPQQRRRLDVIRAHALRVFRLIFVPVGMHADEELVEDQARREDVGCGGRESPRASCAPESGSYPFRCRPDIRATAPSGRRAARNPCR